MGGVLKILIYRSITAHRDVVGCASELFSKRFLSLLSFYREN